VLTCCTSLTLHDALSLLRPITKPGYYQRQLVSHPMSRLHAHVPILCLSAAASLVKWARESWCHYDQDGGRLETVVCQCGGSPPAALSCRPPVCVMIESDFGEQVLELSGIKEKVQSQQWFGLIRWSRRFSSHNDIAIAAAVLCCSLFFVVYLFFCSLLDCLFLAK